MPRALHQKLERRTRKLQRAGKLRSTKDAYIYDTLRKIERRHRRKGGKKGKYLSNP